MHLSSYLDSAIGKSDALRVSESAHDLTSILQGELSETPNKVQQDTDYRQSNTNWIDPRCATEQVNNPTFNSQIHTMDSPTQDGPVIGYPGLTQSNQAINNSMCLQLLY